MVCGVFTGLVTAKGTPATAAHPTMLRMCLHATQLLQLIVLLQPSCVSTAEPPPPPLCASTTISGLELLLDIRKLLLYGLQALLHMQLEPRQHLQGGNEALIPLCPLSLHTL